MKLKIIITAILGFSVVGTAIASDSYPKDKAVKVIAAFAPGSATDISARIVGEVLSKELGATVIVENKPGAQGVIGTNFALRSPADGYTLTITSSSLNSVNPGLFKDLSYDGINDFTHISRLTTMPILLLVKEDSPFSSIESFVNEAKKGNLKYGYGSPGGQVSAVAFNGATNIESLGVPYNGQPPALTDLAAGHVDYVLADLSVATALMKSGRLKALAVSTADRLAEWPDVPTFSESGYSDYDLVVWVGLGGPANIPENIVQKINLALNNSLSSSEYVSKFKQLGMSVDVNSPEDQLNFVKSQRQAWQKRMDEAQIKPQ